MNRLEILDDIDDLDATSPKEISPEDSISKLCVAIVDTTYNKYKGSGVILTPSGIFVSVAHNFDNEESVYVAFFNQHPYEIETLHKEYEQGKSDLFVGRLKNFHIMDLQTEQFPLLTSCDSLTIGSEVYISGFKSFELQDTDIIERISLERGLTISKQRFSKLIPTPDLPQMIVLEEYDNNAIAFMERTGAEKYKGFSGGAVYKGQNLYGLVVSHFLLKSDYIYLCLKELELFEDK